MSAPTETEIADHGDLRSLLEAGDEAAVRSSISDLHPADLADLLDSLEEPERQLQLFRLLDPETASEVVREANDHSKAALVELLSDARLSSVLERLDTDDAADLLGHLEEDRKDRLLRRASPEVRRNVAGLLTYPEDTAGGIMKTEVAVATTTDTVREVVDSIRRHADDFHDIQEIFVTDTQRRLKGLVPLRALLLNDDETPLERFMTDEPISVRVDEDQEEVARVFEKYDLVAVPVLDALGRVVGRITVDDIVDVMVEEETENVLRMGAVEPGALDHPYLTTPFSTMVRKRATWLVALFLGEMLTATAMGYFEDEISKAVVLALFVPLIISSGGNSGSQASTIIIRAMALGEFGLSDWWRIARREVMSGLALGTILGCIGFLRIALWSAFTNLYGPHWILVGITVSLSLVGVVLWGTISGSMLPLLLRRLGADPAASSAPFVATLVDVTGLVIYFSVAMLVMHGTIL